MTRYYFFAANFAATKTTTRRATTRKQAAKILAQLKANYYHITINVITDNGIESAYVVNNRITERFFAPSLRL